VVHRFGIEVSPAGHGATVRVAAVDTGGAGPTDAVKGVENPSDGEALDLDGQVVAGERTAPVAQEAGDLGEGMLIVGERNARVGWSGRTSIAAR
jgi:hypothetical protein